VSPPCSVIDLEESTNSLDVDNLKDILKAVEKEP
jgi:hypothetical protein